MYPPYKLLYANKNKKRMEWRVCMNFRQQKILVCKTLKKKKLTTKSENYTKHGGKNISTYNYVSLKNVTF
jgi:hypothetical protein